MNFYELLFEIRQDMGAEEITEAVRKAAIRTDNSIEVIGCTVHRTPTSKTENWVDRGAVMVIDNEADRGDDKEYNELAGLAAEKYGCVLVDVTEFGKGTLSLKKDEAAIKRFIDDVLGESNTFELDVEEKQHD